jgi:hypothetical protein
MSVRTPQVGRRTAHPLAHQAAGSDTPSAPIVHSPLCKGMGTSAIVVQVHWLSRIVKVTEPLQTPLLPRQRHRAVLQAEASVLVKLLQHRLSSAAQPPTPAHAACNIQVHALRAAPCCSLLLHSSRTAAAASQLPAGRPPSVQVLQPAAPSAGALQSMDGPRRASTALVCSRQAEWTPIERNEAGQQP